MSTYEERLREEFDRRGREIDRLGDLLRGANNRRELEKQRAERAEQQVTYYKEARRELLDKVERAEKGLKNWREECHRVDATLARVRQVLVNADEFGDDIDPDDLRRELEGGGE